MRILVLELATTGSEPELAEVISYGFELLDASLQLVEEGHGMVRPAELELVIGDEALIGKSKKNFLDLLEGLCQHETMLASRHLCQTKRFWEQECIRAKKMMPEHLLPTGLDVSSIELQRKFGETQDLRKSLVQDAPYRLFRHSYPFLDPCAADTKATAAILKHCLLQEHVIRMKAPYEKVEDRPSETGDRVPPDGQPNDR